MDSGNVSAVKSLNELGLINKLINIQDNHFMTPMHIASINYEKEIFDILITFNPDKSLKDEEEKTYIDYLEENDDVDANELILNSIHPDK